ncbi:MAG: VOC family protein [Frankiaceae bacterium]|nr:VOC family protein [Frankiaceae bacterium]MBV9872699.1 VOC family protein [Frankiaceae bacterium]
MAADVLFVGVAVTDFDEAVNWYERVLGKPADVVAVPDQEVMWQVTDGAWLYAVVDPERSGHSLVAIAVDDLDRQLADLASQSIEADQVEDVGGGRKATFTDPAGNSVAFLQV